MLKAFVLRYWPLAVLGILVIAILAMSRYTEDRKQSDKDNAHQSSPATPISPDDASETSENADKTEHPPSWIDTFAWPEGATVWALFLTLLVIAWQSAETREAAKATKKSANAAFLGLEIMMSKERARVSIEILEAILTGFPKVKYRIISHGPTHAFIEDTWMATRVIAESEMDWPKSGDIFGWTIPLPPIFKESEIEGEAFVFLTGTADFKEGIESGKTVLQVMARIEYKDVFGKSHESWAAKYYGIPRDPIFVTKVLRWREGPKQYNRQT
jgi:hypothetical protein